MTKFNEKSLHSFPLAFYYSAIQAFDTRIGAVSTTLARFLEMRAEQHRLFLVFDEAYKQSLKSQSTKTIGDLDKVRDKIAFVIERVAKLWEEKLDFDDTLNIHGRRVAQAFKDFNFRAEEALVAENAKIRNIEQVFASADLTADLAAMGLTELNTRMAELTTQIEQLMSQRNDAVQELQPEEGISQAAMFYNQDLYKVELQLAQSRKGGSASEKPATDGGTTPTTPDTPSDPGTGGDTPGTITPSDPGTGGGDEG